MTGNREGPNKQSIHSYRRGQRGGALIHHALNRWTSGFLRAHETCRVLQVNAASQLALRGERQNERVSIRSFRTLCQGASEGDGRLPFVNRAGSVVLRVTPYKSRIISGTRNRRTEPVGQSAPCIDSGGCGTHLLRGDPSVRGRERTDRARQLRKGTVAGRELANPHGARGHGPCPLPVVPHHSGSSQPPERDLHWVGWFARIALEAQERT